LSNQTVRLAILGSTGSIGTQALDVVRGLPGRFEVLVLTAGTRVQALMKQIIEFSPELVVVKGKDEVESLTNCLDASELARRPRVLSGRDGLVAAAAYEGVDLVLNSLVGSIGLEPTLAAIHAGKDIALANKESLVVGGHLVNQALASSSSRIYPVDGEHSAIAQCLNEDRVDKVRRLILTASGGPFRTLERSKLSEVTPEQALNHPSWRMGPRITVDSATLMNKGFEVVEACWLFGVPPESVEVVIHPESIIHSVVEYVDGSALAQLSNPDMRIAIQYALMRGRRVEAQRQFLDLPGLSRLTFEEPEYEKFPCLSIGYEAARRRGTFGAVINAADEVAVSAFLSGLIAFDSIPRIISETLRVHRFESNPSLSDVLSIDSWARQYAEGLVERIRSGGV